MWGEKFIDSKIEQQTSGGGDVFQKKMGQMEIKTNENIRNTD